MKDLKAMMGKDESGDTMKKDAKLSVLKQLRQMAADMVGDDVKGGLDSMKKVTVAAPDKTGLAEGLAKAKEMLGGADHHDEDEMTDEEMEMPEDEMSEDHMEMSPEEMKAKIAELTAKLASR